MTSKLVIIIEQSFDATSDKVWKALTDNSQMKEWYFDIDSFRPEVGFKFHFTAGDDKKKYLHLCEITEVIPGKKISYTWRYNDFEGNSLLSFELFDEGNYTRLKLIHSGLETFPNLPVFSPESFRKGWDYIIGISLKEFLEKNDIK
jgi:uncharacterized protein YndB with AHSA1/START domain